MKTVKTTLAIAVFSLLLGTFQTNAQHTNALGVRAGGTSGITYKHIGSNSGFEGILGLSHNALSVTGLYEKYAQAFETDGLNWYYGGGGHVAFYHFGHHNHGPWEFNHKHDHNNEAIGLGVDGIVGLEYKIPPIPIAISLDLKPYLEVTTAGNAGVSLDPGLGIKFVW